MTLGEQLIAGWRDKQAFLKDQIALLETGWYRTHWSVGGQIADTTSEAVAMASREWTELESAIDSLLANARAPER